MTYVYCGDLLLDTDGSLNQLLIPDALHPNKQGAAAVPFFYSGHATTVCPTRTGMEAIFKCLQPVVLPMLGAPLEDISTGR